MLFGLRAFDAGDRLIDRTPASRFGDKDNFSASLNWHQIRLHLASVNRQRNLTLVLGI
jgi:hypothetical protein